MSGVLLLSVALFFGCSDSPTDGGETPSTQPPVAPSNPSPAVGDTAITRIPQFIWSCSDADSDSLHYYVRLKTDSLITAADNIIIGAIVDTFYTYSSGYLDFNTTYYWQVVAGDNSGNTTSGPIWNFTTIPFDSTFV